MYSLNNTRSKIATIRSREQAEECELAYLDDLCLAGAGCSDFVDELVERFSDSRSGFDGSADERVAHRAISRAGFATAFRY